MEKTNRDIFKVVNNNKNIFSAMRRMDVAMQLRHHMALHGIKNSDLAERLGVSEANVSKLLKGNQNLQLDTLYMLSDALEEPLSVVVGDIHNLPQSEDEVIDEYRVAFLHEGTQDSLDGSWLLTTLKQDGVSRSSCEIYNFNAFLECKKLMMDAKEVNEDEGKLFLNDFYFNGEEYEYATVNS